MKLIGRTLAILMAACVIVGFWLVLGSFSAGTGALGGGMGGHEMQNGFNLAGIFEILPTLAIVAIITAIVSPIKQRLTSKRRPNQPARRPQATAPEASV
jgi:hypothetical protein